MGKATKEKEKTSKNEILKSVIVKGEKKKPSKVKNCEYVKNIVVISDQHAGCQLGLCPPTVRLDNDGIYKSNKAQKFVYYFWQFFWEEWIPMVTKEEPYIVVNNGDALDGIHHQSTTQISQNIQDQILIAEKLLMPIVKNPLCEKYFHVRGTEAHSGIAGIYEEQLAKELGSVQNDVGQYASWEHFIQIGQHKKLCHFTHTVGTSSSAAYESTAANREVVEMLIEAARWGEKAPDCIVRSHRHKQIEIRKASKNGYSTMFITPGWQLKTPFSYRIVQGRVSAPEIGGYLIREGDEDGLYTRFKVMKTKRPKVIII